MDHFIILLISYLRLDYNGTLDLVLKSFLMSCCNVDYQNTGKFAVCIFFL